MSTSIIPTALDALVAAFTAVLDIEVIDGPPTIEIPLTGLYVGATTDDNKVDFQQTWAGVGGLFRNESFQIPNLLYLRTGDTVLSPVRLALFGHLATIENTLRADPTLGIAGRIVRAEFGTSGGLTQLQTKQGCICLVEFSINVDARI